jgi:hypothetical protein
MAKLIRSCNIAKALKPNLDEKYFFFYAGQSSLMYRLDVATLTASSYTAPGINNSGCRWIGINPTMTKVLGSWSNQLWYKSNGTWVKQNPGGITSKNWSVGGMSDDGSVRFVAWSSGRIYVFENDVWTEHQPEGNVDIRWSYGAISGDGSVIIISCLTAAGGDLHTWKYENSTWSMLAPSGSTTITGYNIAINYDGSRYFFTAGNTGRFWNGSAWTNMSNTYFLYFMTRDGSKYCYVSYAFSPYTAYWLKYFDGTSLIQAAYAFDYTTYDALIKSDLSIGFFGRSSWNVLPKYGYYPFSAITTNFNPAAIAPNYYYQYLKFNKFT